MYPSRKRLRVCGSGFEAHCRLHRDDDRETRWRRPLAKNSGVGSMACPKLITERAQEGRRRQRLRVQSLHPSSVTLLPRRAGRSEPSPAMQRAARHSAMILPGSLTGFIVAYLEEARTSRIPARVSATNAAKLDTRSANRSAHPLPVIRRTDTTQFWENKNGSVGSL